MVINAQYTDRSDLFQGDRGFANFAQFDDTDANGNPILINGGSSGVPGTSIFAGGLSGFSPDSSGIVFGDNGAARPFVTGGDDNDFYNYAPVNYIQLPHERFQANALGHFDVSDKIQVYGRMMFTQSKVPQQLAPTPIFQAGAEFTLDGSPFLPAATQQVLSDALGSGVDSDGDGIDDTATAFVRRRLVEVGPRISDDKYTNFQLLAGVRGDIGETGWTYDVYVSEGEVSNSNTQSGNVNRDRFLQALLLDLNADPTGGTCVDTANNGSTVGCAPMNIFGPGNISDDAAAFLRTAVAAEGEFEQRVWAASFAGDLFNLPAGECGRGLRFRAH